MPNVTSHRNEYIAGAVIIVLIAAGVLWSRGSRAPASPKTDAKTATTTKEITLDTKAATTDDRQIVTQAAGESVAADDQPAGTTVNVSFKLSRDSWVGVRDASGILMGVGRFDASATSGSVELLRPTSAGESYSIVVFADDGNRVYDLYADPLVEGVTGTFKAK